MSMDDFYKAKKAMEEELAKSKEEQEEGDRKGSRGNVAGGAVNYRNAINHKKKADEHEKTMRRILNDRAGRVGSGSGGAGSGGMRTQKTGCGSKVTTYTLICTCVFFTARNLNKLRHNHR